MTVLADDGIDPTVAAVKSIAAQLSRQKRGRGKCLIDPSDWRLGMWDAAGGLLLIYTAIVCPFEVAFLPLPLVHDWRFVVNRVIDAFFAADMAIQLVVMYPHEKPVQVSDQTDGMRKLAMVMNTQRTTVELVTSHRKIAYKYLTGWFLVVRMNAHGRKSIT